MSRVTFAARILLVIVCATAGARALTVVDTPAVTNADVTRWMTELSNWGRWGKDDHLGTLNLINPAKRKQALALARDGVSISLAHTLEKEQTADNPRPSSATRRRHAGH